MRPSRAPDPPLDFATLRRWWSVDLFLLAFLAATILLVALAWARVPAAGGVIAAHAAALALYLMLKRAAARWPAWRIPYVLSPMVLVFAIFSAMGWIIPHLRAETMDASLARWDLRLFGSDPTRWFDSMTPAVATLLQVSYTSYYFLFVALAAVLIWRRQLRTLLSVSGTVVGCLLTTYAGYYLVPALGPRAYTAYEEPLPLTGVARGIHDALDALEKIKLDAFPSGHTALSVLCLLLLFRLRARVAWVMAPFVMGLIVSTVALRYHYAVDVLAGLLCALLWYPFGYRLVRYLDPPAGQDGPSWTSGCSGSRTGSAN